MMSHIGHFVALTKPRVVILLQITAVCAVIVHDVLDSELDAESLLTIAVVLVGGYLTAGGANSIDDLACSL